MPRWLVSICVLLIFRQSSQCSRTNCSDVRSSVLIVCIVWCYVHGAQRTVTRRDVLFSTSRSLGPSALPIYAHSDLPHSPNRGHIVPTRRIFDTFSPAHLPSQPPLAAGSMARQSEREWVFRMLVGGHPYASDVQILNDNSSHPVNPSNGLAHGMFPTFPTELDLRVTRAFERKVPRLTISLVLHCCLYSYTSL